MKDYGLHKIREYNDNNYKTENTDNSDTSHALMADIKDEYSKKIDNSIDSDKFLNCDFSVHASEQRIDNYAQKKGNAISQC